ncbi:MAG: MATE family efflux transporter [Sarcina sp.]
MAIAVYGVVYKLTSFIQLPIGGFLMTIFMFIFSKPLVSLFTKNLTLINSSSDVLRIALLASPLLGVYFISISFYRAIGRAKKALLISLFRRIIFFIPFLYILPLIFNLKITGIWIVLPLSNFLAALFSIFYLLKDRKITTNVKKGIK